MDAQDRGNILLFDFKKPRRGAPALDIVGGLDRSTFSPIGLSIWRDYNSSKSLSTHDAFFVTLFVTVSVPSIN